MLIAAAALLATSKGFALRDTGSAGKYLLIDLATGLPELNRMDQRLWFTLGEAVTFLEPLRRGQRNPSEADMTHQGAEI